MTFVPIVLVLGAVAQLHTACQAVIFCPVELVTVNVYGYVVMPFFVDAVPFVKLIVRFG